MAKPRTVFVCSSCGADAPRWSGQCPSCGEWNTLAAFAEARVRGSGRQEARSGERPEPIARLVTEPETRLTTGFAEFDRVIGGGLVPGSVTLIGGEPGIGKSTLLLQCAAALAKGEAVLYATGEESVRQVAERARRLARGRRHAHPRRRDRGRADPRVRRRGRRESARHRLDPDHVRPAASTPRPAR